MKQRTLRGVLPCAFGLLAALPALAAGGGEDHSGDSMQFVWQAVNLTLLLFILFRLARKPVSGFFADRREEIRSDIDAAGELLSSAEGRHSQWQRKVAELDDELAAIRSRARERAQEEHEHIIAEARARAERVRIMASVAIDQELRRAREELAQEASRLSVERATELLRESVTAQDRDRLMDEFVASIESGSGAGR